MNVITYTWLDKSLNILENGDPDVAWDDLNSEFRNTKIVMNSISHGNL